MKQITVLLPRWIAMLLRRPWLLAAVTVVVCAMFAARAASSLAAAALVGPRATAAPRPAARLPPPAPRDRDGGQLVTRNMFCSSCDAAAATAEARLMEAVLIATSLGAEPRATVRVVASEAQGSWGVGDAIPGLGRVDRIARTWVELLDAAGHRGRLSLQEAVGGDRGAATLADPLTARWPGVRQLDDQTYEVERNLVRELVSGQTKPGAARFVPVFEAGQLAGLRLLGVTETSLPAAFGLKSRDTLTAIDGTPITSLQQGIDLFARLDQLTSVELSGKRDGKPLVRSLRLR